MTASGSRHVFDRAGGVAEPHADRRLAAALRTIALIALLAPAAASGQEREVAVRPIEERQLERPPAWGLLLDEGGGWRAPTPAEALAALRGESNLLGAQSAVGPALALLRRWFESSEAELEALANALGDMLLANPEYPSEEFDLRHSVYAALAAALDTEDEGTPYPAAFDVLVRVYETRAARALADGGDDPFLEVHRRGTRTEANALGMALLDVYGADREGRGRAYLRDLFEASEPPPPCREVEGVALPPPGWEPPPGPPLPPCPNHSVWCAAGYPLMYGGELRPSKPRDVDDPPDPALFERLCRWGW